MQIDAEAVKTASLQLKSFLDYIQNAKSIDQLRGYEGEAASIYFGVFDELILQQKKDFIFQGRNKRPPLDNVNAMLSFVYTLLTNQITSALETVGLDPYVGYMHTDRPGRASGTNVWICLWRKRKWCGFDGYRVTEKVVVGMAEQEKRNDYPSLPQRKNGMGNGSLCSGYVTCAVPKR